MSDDADMESTLEVKGLDKLIKLLKKEAPVTRIGILGKKAGPHFAEIGPNGKMPKDIPSNAEVGVWAEYGTETSPQRSFLRVPIAEHLEKEMESSDAFDEDVLKETLASGTLIPYMKKIAALAEGIVLGAFDTAGYGKWKASQMDHKKVKQTLVETTQLRNSITSEVKEVG